MLKEITEIITASAPQGWVMEPDALHIMGKSGINTPEFRQARTLEKAIECAHAIGYPVAAKVVSPAIMHKSDVGGVAIDIDNDEELAAHFNRFSRMKDFSAMMIQEMVAGVELIVGAKVDYQFGPVILVGIGGTGVEIYQDAAIRMAPITETDVVSMIAQLKAHQLLEGYRGAPPVSMKELTGLLLAFSHLVMELQDQFESMDLNPVICSETKCVAADARIVLAS